MLGIEYLPWEHCITHDGKAFYIIFLCIAIALLFTHKKEHPVKAWRARTAIICISRDLSDIFGKRV